jgi:hypothetical protein
LPADLSIQAHASSNGLSADVNDCTHTSTITFDSVAGTLQVTGAGTASGTAMKPAEAGATPKRISALDSLCSSISRALPPTPCRDRCLLRDR